MAEPYDLQAHLQNSVFVPETILVVLLGMTNYDAVSTKGEQAFENVDEARETCQEVKDYLNNFGV